MRAAPVLLLASLVLASATAASAGRGEVTTKPSVQVTRATGSITRLTRSRITVSKLSCTRLDRGPSLRGLALGARVTISCRNGTLTRITPLSPSKSTTKVAPTVTATPPPPPPAASTAPTPAPGTCVRDTAYQTPAAIGLSVTQTGVIEVIDPPHLYNVSGDTVADINTQIRQCRPSVASPYAAVTRYTLSYRYTSTRQPAGRAGSPASRSASTSASCFPSWTPGLNPAPGLADQWATYIAALALHEQGHVDRYRDGARDLVAQLEAMTELDCAAVSSQVSATVLSFSLGLAREQDAYDTRHRPRAHAGRDADLDLSSDGRRRGRFGLLGLVAALVEPERRVLVGHQRRVRDDAEHPAVHAEHEVEDAARVARGEEQRDAGEEHEQLDQAGPPAAAAPPSSSSQPRSPVSAPAAADEEATTR